VLSNVFAAFAAGSQAATRTNAILFPSAKSNVKGIAALFATPLPNR
jgi:hypothetical protein